MVDCRLCRHAYRIWHEELEDDNVKYKLVCLKREVFIDWKYIPIDPCEDYVDVDCDLSGDRDL